MDGTVHKTLVAGKKINLFKKRDKEWTEVLEDDIGQDEAHVLNRSDNKNDDHDMLDGTYAKNDDVLDDVQRDADN